MSLSSFVQICEVLNITPDASEKDAKDAYRRLAMMWHPDRNQDPSAGPTFQKIAVAYKLWNDISPEIRLKHANAHNRDQIFKNYQSPSAGSSMSPMSSTGTQSQAQPHDEIVIKKLSVEIEQLLRPIHLSVDIDYWAMCGHCMSTGCLYCHKCGYVREHASIPLRVPLGMKHGEVTKYHEYGREIHLVIEILPHQHFQQKGNDLYGTLQMSCFTAMLGATTEVQTLDAPKELMIAPGTSPGHVYKLQGQGLPDSQNIRGDLYFQVDIIIPAIEDKAAIKTLRSIEASVFNTKQNNSWWDKMSPSR